MAEKDKNQNEHETERVNSQINEKFDDDHNIEDKKKANSKSEAEQANLKINEEHESMDRPNEPSPTDYAYNNTPAIDVVKKEDGKDN